MTRVMINRSGAANELPQAVLSAVSCELDISALGSAQVAALVSYSTHRTDVLGEMEWHVSG